MKRHIALTELKKALENSETKKDKLYALEDGNFLSKFSGLTQEDVEELYQEIENEDEELMIKFFDSEGQEMTELAFTTAFELIFRDDEWLVVGDSFSEIFKTEAEAMAFITQNKQ